MNAYGNYVFKYLGSIDSKWMDICVWLNKNVDLLSLKL
jgi:hypothetical protein